ncbi:MAG: mycofactocin-associated electron transfer flavoprotein beta subunit [Acidimicrobiales bacterium]
MTAGEDKGPRVGVAMKWVDRRPSVDPLTGLVSTDPRSSGPSAADEAALEWGLRLAEDWSAEVVVASVGPAPATAMLVAALEAGAHRAVRVEAEPGAPSPAVADALALALAGSDLILCGDWSLDRGSGSVPAFLAGRLGAAQALGLVGLAAVPGRPGAVTAERRLDGGRRERARLLPPAVVSVEGGTTRLRRAPLPAVLSAHPDRVEVLTPPDPVRAAPPPAAVGPFRPRPRVLPSPDPALPARARVAALVGGEGGLGRSRRQAELVVADPAEGAERLLDALQAWGELA